jgi:hypothetical protein
MLRLLAAAMVPAGLAHADGAGVPSGQALALWEVRWETVGDGPAPGSTQMVLRLIAPALGTAEGPDYEMALADMDWLCLTHAVPLSRLAYAQGDRVVVNLTARPVPRGAADPDTVQYFQTYRIVDGACEAEDAR